MDPKYSKDIYGDEDAYYMGCPEIVSKHLAQRLSDFDSAIELCCGAGMICVQLAKEIDEVIGVDIRERRVKNAEKNAKLYDVSENTNFLVGDATDEKLLKKLSAEVVVLEPDWSSPGSKKNDHASKLKSTQPCSDKLFKLTKRHITENIVFRAPKTFSTKTLGRLGPCKIENIYWNNELKFKIVYYFPDLEETTEEDIHFDPKELLEE